MTAEAEVDAFPRTDLVRDLIFRVGDFGALGVSELTELFELALTGDLDLEGLVTEETTCLKPLHMLLDL